MENAHSFVAIKGIQAGREYYVTMIPLNVIPKLFLFDESELPAAFRSQRILNRNRIPEISQYLVSNSRNYAFSSLTASVDGKVRFEPLDSTDAGRKVGRLVIPMTARFLINDGQHRRAAIEEALRERPELSEESISVIFFIDAGLKRSQQMFADLNRHVVRPSQSLTVLYDHRDPLSRLTCKLANEVSVFRQLTETEKSGVSVRSNKLFSLSGIYQATRSLLGKNKKRITISNEEEETAHAFWELVGENISDWKLASKKAVSCAELRKDYVHAHGVALEALGISGATLLKEKTKAWKSKIKAIGTVDWHRNSIVWQGRAVINGRMCKSHANVVLSANLLKQVLGLSLGDVDQRFEKTLPISSRIAA